MTTPTGSIDRSTFLRRAGGAFGIVLLDHSRLAQFLPRPGRLEHPEPREAITAERVLTADALGSSRRAKVADAYAAARKYPATFDGIACGCSCGGKSAMHRSLLVCYETMQPTGCGECQQEAELVGRLAGEGKALGEIRSAVDKQFG